MEEQIRKYANLMRELGLTGLEIKENGTAMRLERNGQPAAESAMPQIPSGTDHAQSVCSPMVGVFYSAPAENASPFVQVGDIVRKGDVLCIIEAMKLMNEITAEEDGTIVEICAKNGQVVDFGRVLFRLGKEPA